MDIKIDGLNDENLTKILIVDDHMFLSEGIALALMKNKPNCMPLLAHSIADALTILNDNNLIDLVILDLKIEDSMGLKTIDMIISLASPGKVVLMSGNADLRVVQASIEKGAFGLIPKSLSMKSMLSVIDLVLSGESFLPTSEVLSHYAGESDDGKFLSQVEIDTLKLTSEGFTNKEIASYVGATEVTVKMHMRNICRKLGARNRAHAVTIGIERKIV